MYYVCMTVLSTCGKLHDEHFNDIDDVVKYAVNYADSWNGDIVILRVYTDPYTNKPNEAKVEAIVKPGGIVIYV